MSGTARPGPPPAGGTGLPPFMQPGAGSQNSTTQPGGTAGVNQGGVTGLSGYDYHNHMRNQMVTSAGVAGGGGGMIGGGGGGWGSGGGGANPMNMGGGSPQFGSANYYLRQIASTDQIIAANTGRGSTASFGGGPGGYYPGGAFTGGFWRPGGGGPTYPPPGGGGFPPGGFGPGMPWPPPGGGGGGGGGGPGGGGGGPGGGGGGGGGWGGGGGHLPFAAAFGLGASSRMIGIGIAAEYAAAAEEMAFIPQNAGKLAMSALGNATPYNNIMLSMAKLRRSGTYGGSLTEAFGAEGAAGAPPPEWMLKLGLGPTEATKLLMDTGIRPRTTEQAVDMATGLGRMSYDERLSMLSEGMAQRSAGQAMRMGLISPDEKGINAFTNIIGIPLAKAVEQGVDAAQVLRSIDTSMAAAAQSGQGVGGIASLTDYLMKYINTPGRTDTGLHAAAGVEAAVATVGSDPARTVAYSGWTAKLKTEADLKGLMNSVSGPGAWEEYMKDPVRREEANQYLRLNSQNSYFAIGALSDLFKSGPLGGAGTATSDYMLSNNIATQQYGNPDISIAARMRMTGKTRYETLAADQEINKGTVITTAKRRGLPPALMQALAEQESGYQSGRTSSAGAMGVMQLMPDTAREQGLKDREVWDPVKNIDAGEAYFQKMLVLFNGNYEQALEAYNWGPAHEKDIRAGRVPKDVKKYATGIMWNASRIDEANTRAAKSPGVDPQSGAGPIMNIPDMGNMPGSVGLTLETISRAKTAGIEGSGYSSREMSTVLPAALNTLNGIAKEGPPLISALQRFFKALNDGEAAAGGGGSGPPQGIPLQ
jgi:hypothetical protein